MIPFKSLEDSEPFLSVPELMPELHVTKLSRFEDSNWDFRDRSWERLNSVNPSKLQIEWSRFVGKIPERVITAIKALAFAYVHCSKVVAKRRKPNTICTNVRHLLVLFESIYEESLVSIGDHEWVSHINSIFDVDIADIQKGIDVFPFAQPPDLFMIKSFCSREIVREINRVTNDDGTIKWSTQDVEKLSRRRKDSSKKYRSAIPLPDHLVIKLIVAASSDVCWFLKRMNIPTQDSHDYYDDDWFKEHKTLDITSAFNDYKEYRKRYASHITAKGRRSSPGDWWGKKFKVKHNLSMSQFKRLVERIQMASRYLILQFTGARYSETISFKNDCVFEKNGEYFVKGTVIKGVDERLITNTDHWVAIPIVRDAIKVLKLINEYTFQEYLFASGATAVLNIKTKGLSNSGINLSLNKYLYDIDNERCYSVGVTGSFDRRHECVKREFLLSTHRIRNTLANQLFKCRASLQVIAYHFHHSYMAIKLYKIPNEVTAGYGNINREILNSAAALERGKMEIIESIYSPDSVLAGGGAEAFTKRRTEFFTGEYARGLNKAQILKSLLKRSLPLADVVLGYCGGKRKTFDENGNEKDPPCIGNLRCNPGRCGNAIVPAAKKIFWERNLEHNKKLLEDPRFFYARDSLIALINEAESVLKLLNGGDTKVCS